MKMKKGIVLLSLDDENIKRAFEFIERTAPHITRGFMNFKNDIGTAKHYLKSCDIPSLVWYDDYDDFLYWGHEKFIKVNGDNFLGEL